MSSEHLYCCILSTQVLLQAFCDSILQAFRFFGFFFFDFTPFIEQLQKVDVYPTDFYTVSWVDAFGVVSAHSCGKVWRVDLDFFKGVCVRFGPHKGMEERLGWFMLCLCWEFRWYMLKARHLKCCWCVDSKRQTPLANFFTSIHRILFQKTNRCDNKQSCELDSLKIQELCQLPLFLQLCTINLTLFPENSLVFQKS